MDCQEPSSAKRKLPKEFEDDLTFKRMRNSGPKEPGPDRKKKTMLEAYYCQPEMEQHLFDIGQLTDAGFFNSFEDDFNENDTDL